MAAIKRNLPEGAFHHASVDAFLASPERTVSGVHTIMSNGHPVDVKFENRGYDDTLVSFHAAMSPAKFTLPVFTGVSISEHLPVNRLFLCDPSLYISANLSLAWFAGSSRQPTLQKDITDIIRGLGSETGRTICFGASGGGFASLYYASRLPRALAVPVNPQTSLAKYNQIIVERYLKLAWQGEALDGIPITHDLIDAYAAGGDTSVRYIQNTGDSSHMSNHFEPFMEALPAGHHVEPVLVDVGDGHVPPPKAQLKALLTESATEFLADGPTGTVHTTR